MLRMTAVTLGSLFAVFLAFGGELSQDEQADLDALRADRTSVVATMSAAFNSNPNRQGNYVPTLAELKTTQTAVIAPQAATDTPQTATLQLASYTPAAALQADNISTTTVANPEKLSALLGNDAEKDIILRSVAATRVNVRSGPSTNNTVLGSVVQADIVRVISDENDGWVKIIIEGGGVEGYMAARFLTDVAQ